MDTNWRRHPPLEKSLIKIAPVSPSAHALSMLELIAAAALGTSSEMDFLARCGENRPAAQSRVPVGHGATALHQPPPCDVVSECMLLARLSTHLLRRRRLAPPGDHLRRHARRDAQLGSVEENKSLYWHPSVYIFEAGTFTLAPI